MREIVPSLLAADFSCLAQEIASVEEAGAKRIHFDVMDGQFVPNLSFGSMIMKSVREFTKLHFEAHLMVNNPENLINPFRDAGADTVIFHAEATNHSDRLISDIKSKGMKAGISINPATPLSVIEDIIKEIDILLIMTVNPGFGGQTMIKRALTKVRAAKSIDENLLIEIDGGVDELTIADGREAGTDLFVCGSTLFGSDDVPGKFEELTGLVNL